MKFMILSLSYPSGQGNRGAIAPVILRKRLIAPVILPGKYPNFEDDFNK